MRRRGRYLDTNILMPPRTNQRNIGDEADIAAAGDHLGATLDPGSSEFQLKRFCRWAMSLSNV